MTLTRTIELLKEYLKMNNIIELTNVNKYRLDEINKIRDYFNNEIKERKDMIKKLNKYIDSFDYLDKIFIALSPSFGTLSIASYEELSNIITEANIYENIKENIKELTAEPSTKEKLTTL